MNKYILDQLDGDDKVIKFRDLNEIRYPIIVEDIEDMRIGGVELMVYLSCFITLLSIGIMTSTRQHLQEMCIS